MSIGDIISRSDGSVYKEHCLYIGIKPLEEVEGDFIEYYELDITGEPGNRKFHVIPDLTRVMSRNYEFKEDEKLTDEYVDSLSNDKRE